MVGFKAKQLVFHNTLLKAIAQSFVSPLFFFARRSHSVAALHTGHIGFLCGIYQLRGLMQYQKVLRYLSIRSVQALYKYNKRYYI